MKFLDDTEALYPGWHSRRACVDPELWDHDQHDNSNVAGCPSCDEARGICSGCPVRAICLAAALTEETAPSVVRAMIRGGLTPGERDQIAGEDVA